MIKIKIFRGLLFSLFLVFFVSQNASAVGPLAPDSGDYSSGADINMVISKTGPGNSLNAPVSRSVIYVPVSKKYNSALGPLVDVSVFNGEFGSECPGDSKDSSAHYNFLAAGSAVGVKRVDSDELGCGWGYKPNWVLGNRPWIPVSVSGASVISFPGLGNFYKIYVTGYHDGPDNGGGVNAYKVRGPSGSYASFFNGSGTKFALQDRSPSATRRAYSDYNLNFGLPCDITSTKTITLKWFDDDFDNPSAQGKPIKWKLYRRPYATRNTAPWQYVTGANARAGNNKEGSANVTVDPGYVYTWRWEDVDGSNGLQFEMPFDSIFFDVDCNYDAVGSFTVQCSSKNLYILAGDADRYGYGASEPPWVYIYIDGELWKSTRLGPLSYPGTGESYFDLPSKYSDGKNHKVKVVVVEFPKATNVDLGEKDFKCGSPVVSTSPDKKASFDPPATSPKITADQEVIAGDEYFIGIKAWNEGDKTDGITQPIVWTDQPSIVEHTGFLPSTRMSGNYPGGNAPQHFIPTQNNLSCTPAGIPNQKCWAWETIALPKNGSSSNSLLQSKGVFKFKVDDNAVTGTEICFGIYNTPRDDGSIPNRFYDIDEKICVEVKAKPSKPVVRFNGGDVQAGAVATASVDEFSSQLCNDPSAVNSDVQGGIGPNPYVDTYSGGEYGVFATGNIKRVASNNKVIDQINSGIFNSGLANDLYFQNKPPNKGKYEPICRPDLGGVNIPADVKELVATGPDSRVTMVQILAKASEGGGTNHILLKPSGASSFVRIGNESTSPTDHISIIPNGRKLTVYTETGVNIAIRGDIKYTGNYGSRQEIPSFAAVSGGDIALSSKVSNLHGFYSASDGFDTCGEIDALGYSITTGTGGAACHQKLDIYGAVMAKQIFFRRTIGGIDLPATHQGESKFAETFTFAPELILSPPDFGSGINTSVIRNGYQELPPVF